MFFVISEGLELIFDVLGGGGFDVQTLWFSEVRIRTSRGGISWVKGFKKSYPSVSECQLTRHFLVFILEVICTNLTPPPKQQKSNMFELQCKIKVCNLNHHQTNVRSSTYNKLKALSHPIFLAFLGKRRRSKEWCNM